MEPYQSPRSQAQAEAAPKTIRPQKAGHRRKQRSDKVRTSDYYGLWAAFLIPVAVMVGVFIQRGIFPFGDASFLRTDMYHQYAPFFSEFNHKLTSGGSLFYSWDIGMGVNFTALYAYYLASPLNWLILLCPKSLIIEFMTYFIVIKIGLSGLSMAYYLKKHCHSHQFGIAFFGIFYALSGYMAAYSWNIMWLDCILLFPLILYGLERLVKEGKCYLYCISLGLCILSNYYISIMICLFLVFYFFALIIMEEHMTMERFFRSGLRFAVFSLLAGGLAAIVLLPEIFALQATASGNFSFPKTVTSYFPIFDMIARHMVNVKTEIGLDHWPNIYCGVAALIFVPLYLSCTRIPVRKKAVYMGLILMLFASFSINVLNFTWHGFHYPNSLPCRQSFIYVFLVLVMCYEGYRNLRSISWGTAAKCFWGAVIFVLLAQKLVTEDHFDLSVFYITLILLAMYAGLIYLYKHRRLRTPAVLLLALALVAGENAMNTSVTSVTTVTRSIYLNENKNMMNLADSVKNDKDFFRMERTDAKTKNDGAWLHFPSASLFSSTAQKSLTDFFRRMGCESSTNAYSINGSTPFVDSLISLRYAMYPSMQLDSQLKTLVDSAGSTYLYENNYTLPLGFMLGESVETRWQSGLGNPADVQNSLSKVVGGDDILVQVDGDANGQTFRFTPETDGLYYVYVSNKKVETVNASLADGSKKFSNVDRSYLLELGRCQAGTEIVLKCEETDQTLTAMAYLFDEASFIRTFQLMNAEPFVTESVSDTKITGFIESVRDGLLFTSIPYEKGWSVTVDGQKVKTQVFNEAFLAFPLTAGVHHIEFHYVPDGFTIGLLLTLISILLLILIDIGRRILIPVRGQKRRAEMLRRREEEERQEEAADQEPDDDGKLDENPGEEVDEEGDKNFSEEVDENFGKEFGEDPDEDKPDPLAESEEEQAFLMDEELP